MARRSKVISGVTREALMRVVLNLNERVKVLLTEEGLAEWNKFRRPSDPTKVRFIETSMWELMQAFGPLISWGSPTYFDRNEIQL
jgi:hypothetical protein